MITLIYFGVQNYFLLFYFSGYAYYVYKTELFCSFQ